MKKKFSIMLLCVLTLTFVLSACGSKNADSGKPAEPQGEFKEAHVEAPDVLGIKLTDLNGGGTLGGQYKGQKIVVATRTGDFADALKNAAKYFEEASGATVEIQSFPAGNDIEKIQLDLNTGHHFDAVLMPVANVHGYAEGGLIQDLQPFTNSIASPNLDIDDFIPSLWKSYALYKGRMVAFPYKPDSQLFFYRKDLFEDPEIQKQYKEKTGKELAVPTTVEDFLSVAEFFTVKTNPDSPTKYGYSSMASKTNSRLIWQNRLAAFGGKDVDENFKPAFNNEAGLKAMQTMLELKKFAPDEWLQLGWDEANALFASGEVAMMEQWPGLYSTIEGDQSKVKGKVGFGVTPGGAPTMGGWAIAMTNTAKNPEATYKFLEYVTSKDGELLKINNTMDPTRTSNYNRPEVLASSPMYPALLESLSAAQILVDPDVPFVSAKLNDIMENAIQGVLRGELNPQAALDDMEQNFIKEIKAVGLSL
ncbi:sugar ABC transporter substrate-binding protein [Paenibacillus sp. Marseille-P2973]|uniref:ABC transporter substrate-binding protein n=1 Tax=Paenibacillus sp. Marseille-P2973 TaxID=1871032 RepID=UPI001B374FB5|nr:sugar ABC transporter substrate-binding protein [Paenibacillus sp. Marseille-P2973]MBQ4901083.1 sugar ABC transporter substrate-binding protein [Paenibacillus sp. Marseille-P2973]